MGQAACLNFPLMSVLKANMVFHEEDAIAFMQQRGIPMQYADFFQRHISELLREKYSKVFTPYYNSGVFNLDYAYRGLLSVYLGSAKMLEWYQIVAQLIILCGNENTNKTDAFWNRFKQNAKERATDVATALAENLTQMVGFSYDLTKGRPMDKVAEAMKYNAITQGMAVNEADPYKQLKIENSVRLQQLNTILSSIKENTKLHETFAPAFERLSENVREVGKAAGGVVGEAAVVGHQGDDAVFVYLKLLIIIYVGSGFLCCRGWVGDVQPLLVEAVASHHAAYGVADELLHHHVVVPYYMFVIWVCHCSFLNSAISSSSM